ncbi:MAG: DUF1328 family protein [Sulfitobacter sp.]
MLSWAGIFLAVALIAAAFAYSGMAGASADAARVVFHVFTVLGVGALVAKLINDTPR